MNSHLWSSEEGRRATCCARRSPLSRYGRSWCVIQSDGFIVRCGALHHGRGGNLRPSCLRTGCRARAHDGPDKGGRAGGDHPALIFEAGVADQVSAMLDGQRLRGDEQCAPSRARSRSRNAGSCGPCARPLRSSGIIGTIWSTSSHCVDEQGRGPRHAHPLAAILGEQTPTLSPGCVAALPALAARYTSQPMKRRRCGPGMDAVHHPGAFPRARLRSSTACAARSLRIDGMRPARIRAASISSLL